MGHRSPGSGLASTPRLAVRYGGCTLLVFAGYDSGPAAGVSVSVALGSKHPHTRKVRQLRRHLPPIPDLMPGALGQAAGFPIMRQFMRHPANITIEVTAGSELDHAARCSHNVGLGGLAFQSDRPLPNGTVIELRIPIVRPAFETRARVVWCRASDAGYDMGVEFLDPNDVFRARMVEQICHIEDYRAGVFRSEGRELTAEQAAMEWIGKYASQFSDEAGEKAEEAA